MKKYLNYAFFVVAGFLALNIVWLVLAKLLDIKALPEPQKVYLSYKAALNAGIFGHLLASIWRIGAGLLISAVIAVVIGVSMGYSKKINKALGPLLYLSYPVPKLALLPVVLLFFGVGDASKIILVVLIIVFQLILSIRDAVQQIPEETYDVFVSLRAGVFTKIKEITIPAVIPEILSSIRISSGIALSVLIVLETYGTDKGLGFYINDAWMRTDYTQMYFAIILISVAGFMLFLLLDILETVFCKWKR